MTLPAPACFAALSLTTLTSVPKIPVLHTLFGARFGSLSFRRNHPDVDCATKTAAVRYERGCCGPWRLFRCGGHLCARLDPAGLQRLGIWEGGVLVTGLELVAGYLVAYVVRKGRRVAKGADAEVDRILDAGLERLDALVGQKLGEDAALLQLQQEASGEGAAKPRTAQRVQLAVEDAAEADSAFAAELQQVLDELRAAGGSPRASAGDYGVASGRDVTISGTSGGVAAGVIHGPVSTAGNPPQPGPAKG
jgi:hypothetical protein